MAYFSLWAVRLAGFLPALDACHGCGAWLDDPDSPQRSFFSRAEPGLRCINCRRAGDWELTVQSRVLAGEMLRKPVEQFSAAPWSRESASDLRRYLVQRIEDSIDRKLVTVSVLEEC